MLDLSACKVCQERMSLVCCVPVRMHVERNSTYLLPTLPLALQVAPWSKTGGLGDVLGSLPIALAARGHRVMVVVPRYANYEEPIDTGVSAAAGLPPPSAAQARSPAAAERESS